MTPTRGVFGGGLTWGREDRITGLPPLPSRGVESFELSGFWAGIFLGRTSPDSLAILAPDPFLSAEVFAADREEPWHWDLGGSQMLVREEGLGEKGDWESLEESGEGEGAGGEEVTEGEG